MINSLDLAIGTTILLIGMAYWTTSVIEHNNNYVDAVKSEYLFDKGISTMEKLSQDGTLQDAVLLYYFNKSDEAKKLLEENIPLDNYMIYIDDNLLINYSNSPTKNYVVVIAVLTLNRSEGWYVIYGNSSEIHISDRRFMSYEEAYNKYNNYTIDMPVYLSKSITSSKVKLYVMG
ncbi:hypothetical protein ACO3VM_04570 [Methanocaldococcus sp. 10A]